MMYLQLFWDFFVVSCFSFGGAYGAIPLIRDMVLSNGWLSEEQLAYIIAVSESTPGPIMVNLATFIGNQQGGLMGSLLATIAVILPAYLVILMVMGILKNTLHTPWVQAVLQGLKPCVTGIILATGCYMVFQNCLSVENLFSIREILISIILLTIMILYRAITKKKLSPLILIGISACLGMIVFAF